MIFYFTFSIKNHLTVLQMSQISESDNLSLEEINDMKDRMDKIKNKLDTYKAETYNDRFKLCREKRQQIELCNSTDECAKNLEAHLKVCDGDYKCTQNYVAYECTYKENGRCSHYYEIKHIDERLEDYEYTIDSYTDLYQDLQISHERALAIKENRYDEYKRKIEQEFDDMCW